MGRNWETNGRIELPFPWNLLSVIALTKILSIQHPLRE